MKERIFTTKEQGRVLVEAGLPISTASGFRDKYLDQLHSMEDNAGRIGLIEAVTPDVSNPVWDVGTLLNLLPYEIEGSTFECYKLEHAWSVAYRDIDEIPIYWSSERLLIDTLFSLRRLYTSLHQKMRNDIHLYETSYWVSPIPSTGCSRVRSPDSFTELNVFDFTYPTNIFLG